MRLPWRWRPRRTPCRYLFPMQARADKILGYPTAQGWPLEAALIYRLVPGAGGNWGENIENQGPLRRQGKPHSDWNREKPCVCHVAGWILNLATTSLFPRHISEHRTPRPMFWDLSSPLLSLSIMRAGVKACIPSLVMCPLLQMIHLVG